MLFWGELSLLAPADRGIAAAAVPGAAVGLRAQLAAAHQVVGLADARQRPVELLAKVVEVEAVAGYDKLLDPGGHHAAGPRIALLERHVDAAGCPQLEQPLYCEHVEGGLEAVLLALPAGRLVAIDALAPL